MKNKIYLIGSLKNKKIPLLGNELRKIGYEVFDEWFTPGPHADDFLRKYEQIRGHTFKEALKGLAVEHIYSFDKKHLDESDTVILCMPCGKSGHMELGYAIGQGKKGYVLFEKEVKRYDIMYKFATDVFTDKKELFKVLKRNK